MYRVLIRTTFQIRDALASQIGLFIIGTEDALHNGRRLDELGIEDTGELFMLQEPGQALSNALPNIVRVSCITLNPRMHVSRLAVDGVWEQRCAE